MVSLVKRLNWVDSRCPAISPGRTQHARHTMGTQIEVSNRANAQLVNKMLALFARALPIKILWAGFFRFHNVRKQNK